MKQLTLLTSTPSLKKHKNWTTEEISFLKENHKRIFLKEICNQLLRSASSIRCKCIRLNIDWRNKPHNLPFRDMNGRFLKGHKNSKESEEKRANSLSESSKGKKLPQETKSKISNSHKIGYKLGKIELRGVALLSKYKGFSKGENNPRFKYDKTNPPLCKCGCGKPTNFSYSLKRFRDYLHGHSSKGEHNPAWLGGKSFEPHTPDFNNKFKRAIRKRDNQVCMLCGIHKEKLNRALSIHHINYDKKLTIPQNCISLCLKCHISTNKNRSQWIEFFQSLLSEKYGYKYNENQEIILEVK